MGILVTATKDGYYGDVVRKAPHEDNQGKVVRAIAFEIKHPSHFACPDKHENGWMKLVNKADQKYLDDHAAYEKAFPESALKKGGAPAAEKAPSRATKGSGAKKPATENNESDLAKIDPEREAFLSDIRQAMTNDIDPNNDSHWTEKGVVSPEAISEIMGVEVSAEDINGALPNYTRDQALVDSV